MTPEQWFADLNPADGAFAALRWFHIGCVVAAVFYVAMMKLRSRRAHRGGR